MISFEQIFAHVFTALSVSLEDRHFIHHAAAAEIEQKQMDVAPSLSTKTAVLGALERRRVLSRSLRRGARQEGNPDPLLRSRRSAPSHRQCGDQDGSANQAGMRHTAITA
jgi:hypothetical protein